MLDAAFLSHVVLWVIGALAVCGTVSSCVAMIAMAKAGNRKD